MEIDPVFLIAKYHGADDEVSREIAILLRGNTFGYREFWLERLTDLKGWCRSRPGDIPEYLTVESVRRGIKSYEEWNDPFHPDTIRLKAWIAAASAGGDFISEDIETGEIVYRYTLPGSREGAAPEN